MIMRKVFILLGGVLLLGGAGVFWYLQAFQAPAIPAPTAVPNLVTVNTPTQVLFTVSIPQPTLNPASVNLLRIKSDGSSTIVAPLVDNGQNGDQKPGDKVFTARLTLNETQPGTFGFQVSAAFRGILRRTLSGVQMFPILAPATFPVVLPPDPGEAGKATLAGVDFDGDGVRDDIQRHIIFTHPESEGVRMALSQLAKAEQALILATDKAAAIAAGHLESRALDCVYSLIGESPQSFAATDDLVARFLDTPSRSRSFIRADAYLGGEVFYLTPEDEMKAQCVIDASTLEN